MRVKLTIALMSAILLAALGSARADDGGRLSSLMRESSQIAVAQQTTESQVTAPVFGGEIGSRLKHASHSLLLPGWAQLRSHHTYRAAFFLTTEAAIWTSFAVFKSQGHSRENSYQEYAVNFAGIDAGSRDDNYWRSLGSYRDSDAYNEDRRRDLRIGLDPSGPEYAGGDAWQWQSEARFEDYNALRRDANSAYDHADLVVVLALVNRLVSFIDAMRSGPPSSESDGTQDHLLQAGGFGMDLGVGPDWSGGVASSLTLSRSF
jgi:hypothetical protein